MEGFLDKIKKTETKKKYEFSTYFSFYHTLFIVHFFEFNRFVTYFLVYV